MSDKQLSPKRPDLATRADCSEWWTFVLTGINGWTAEAALAREGAIWFACQHYPRQVWTKRTALDVWHASPAGFLPTPGEVMAVFDRLMAEIETQQRLITDLGRPALLGVESTVPYALPPPPHWASGRRAPGASVDTSDFRHPKGCPPERTIEQQLAALQRKS